MAHYSRSIAHQSRAADTVYSLIRPYSFGVTVRQLMSEHSDRLKDANSVLAAIDLLAEEGKVLREKSFPKPHYLDAIKVYPI
jgi:hypothetical protein